MCDCLVAMTEATGREYMAFGFDDATTTDLADI